jgi:acetolactate synthase small subunit
MRNSILFDVTAENYPDVMARVVLQLHRLAIPVLELSIARKENCSSMKVQIQVDADSDRIERIEEKLLNLAQVLCVHSHMTGCPEND